MERPKQHSIPTISGDATYASLGIFDFMNHKVPDVAKDTLDKNWCVPFIITRPNSVTILALNRYNMITATQRQTLGRLWALLGTLEMHRCMTF